MTTNEEQEKKDAEGMDEESMPEAPDALTAGDKPATKAESRSNGDPNDEVAKANANADASADEKTGGDADAKDDAKDKITYTGPAATPVQLGYRRYVYAAYFGAAIVVAFIGSKFGNMIYFRVSQWKPTWDLGDPKDEIIMPVAAVIGGLVAFYYYKKPKSRQYVDEVANELSQVTWPNRKEVTNSTAVVIVTTVFATVFFALMDRFWGFVTNLVYGS